MAAWAEDDDTTIEHMPNQSPALDTVQTIEDRIILEYVKENTIKSEIGSLFAAFFDRRREHLPENPYPEITKRFRQIEVRYIHKLIANNHLLLLLSAHETFREFDTK